MIHKSQPEFSWRMREEGEMFAFVAECPECNRPANTVISSALLRDPLTHLPELYCPRCRKRFPGGNEVVSVLPLRAPRPR